MTKIDTFIEYLIKKDILYQYVTNIKKYSFLGHAKSFNSKINKLIYDTSSYDWLNACFSWDSTEQGHSYWSRLCDDWREKCD